MSGLPSQDFHLGLSCDDVEILSCYTKELLQLSTFRDPEVTSRILQRMDLQLEALAKLPQSDDIPEYHFVDPNRSCDRASLTKWLRKHNPHGLHTIQLQTLSKLRCTVDDLWPIDVPAFLELFGEYDLMPWVADVEGGQRQQEYRCKLVEQKEGCRFIFTELFGMDH